MSTKFYTLLTDIGAAKLASAAALGVPLKITHMAVGDGGGTLPTPDAKQTALVNEKRRAALNMLYIDPQNSSQIIAEQVIPENEGGWWIREVGLFDESGALIAVGNCPESYKPQLAEGSGRTQTVRMVLITSSTDNITLKIDPAVVLATRHYVDQQIEIHEQSRRHPSASLTEKGFVCLYSGVESNDETVAATPKAVKIAMDNASARLAKDRNGSDIPNPALFVQNLGLKTTVDKAASAIQPGDYGIGLAYLKTMGTKSQFFAYGTAVGYPEVPTHGAGFQACYNDNRRAQIYVSNDGKMYCRFSMLSKIADDETPWNQVFTSAHYPEASVSVKGMVQLGNDVNSVSENVAATLKAVKIAMDNASARLAKDRNGADIPDPTLFIQNLGLKPTVIRLKVLCNREHTESVAIITTKWVRFHSFLHIQVMQMKCHRMVQVFRLRITRTDARRFSSPEQGKCITVSAALIRLKTIQHYGVGVFVKMNFHLAAIITE